AARRSLHSFPTRRSSDLPARFGRLNVSNILAQGFGVATVNYSDIDADAPGAVAAGVRALYLKPGQTEPAPDEWGSIAAWAWGLRSEEHTSELQSRSDLVC